ncbi:hypothetical protein R1sor_011067 [Riccia sorocarpa]|uniref:Aldehyde dehydrogenase domain-containing protein n=1 Tax=Riccia sorocarpa TaxID=122646 RepID=A0ABD3I184_9MARC
MQDSLAEILTKEMGKPINQAKNEIRHAVVRISSPFHHHEAQIFKEQTICETSKYEERILYEPLGVIANISAWNYPYFVSSNIFAGGLMAGNSILYKPSEYASLSGREITRLLHEAGVPEDVFMLCTGKGETGAAVASLKGLGGIYFTGSVKTGVEISKAAAPNLVKVQLELGGKDPVYVRQDVKDVARAAATIAEGAFYNCGQSCCSVERIYVHEKIFPEFMDNFVNTVKSYKVGDPMDKETFIGPVAREAQVPFLASQVQDAVTKGANVVVGGENVALPSEGFWFSPTVLTDVDHSMNVMREESFGPVIGIQAVSGDAEALELMKDTPYGLTAGVFSESRKDAEAILRELDVGTAYWNCCDRVSARLPWSGRKASGIGATLGLDGLRSFVQPKAYFLHEKMGT